MTNNQLSVDQAQAKLQAAQDDLDAAMDRQAIADSYPKVGELSAVLAVEVSFDQFVTYAQEGLLLGVFQNEERAASYAAASTAPAGTMLVVRPVALLS